MFSFIIIIIIIIIKNNKELNYYYYFSLQMGLTYLVATILQQDTTHKYTYPRR
jgi:hypothetical protein